MYSYMEKYFSGSLLKRLRPNVMFKVMADMHERFYNNHSGGRSMVRRIMLQIFYWLILLKDSERYAKE